jgi:hypothetical protein
VKPLTPNQREVLENLEYLHLRPDQCDRTVNRGDPAIDGKWGTCLAFGGSNGSHHSATATALAKRGLVDRLKGNRLNFFQSRTKGSCYYRITEAGIAALAATPTPADEAGGE